MKYLFITLFVFSVLLCTTSQTEAAPLKYRSKTTTYRNHQYTRSYVRGGSVGLRASVTVKTAGVCTCGPDCPCKQ